jgi:ribonuclease HI
MTNFIAECRFEKVIIDNPSPDLKLVDPGSPGQILSQCWQLYVDDSSTQDGNGAGILLINPAQVYQYRFRFRFLATNNVAEYGALIAGLGLAEALKAYSLQVHSDSQLIVGQYQGTYEAKDPTMILYFEKVKVMLA